MDSSSSSLLAPLLAPFNTLRCRIAALERVLSKRRNMLIFLVIRFVLMSGMVLGFTWTAISMSH